MLDRFAGPATAENEQRKQFVAMHPVAGWESPRKSPAQFSTCARPAPPLSPAPTFSSMAVSPRPNAARSADHRRNYPAAVFSPVILSLSSNGRLQTKVTYASNGSSITNRITMRRGLSHRHIRMATEISNGRQSVKLITVERGKAMYQLAYYAGGKRGQKNLPISRKHGSRNKSSENCQTTRKPSEAMATPELESLIRSGELWHQTTPCMWRWRNTRRRWENSARRLCGKRWSFSCGITVRTCPGCH